MPHPASSQNTRLAIEYLAPGALTPSSRNARRHSPAQIKKLAAAIQEFGFCTPLLIDAGSTIIAGHARIEAAKSLGLAQVPCVRLASLSPEQARALAIADNRLAEIATWDPEILAAELAELGALDIGFELEITGFETPEIDLVIQAEDKRQRKMMAEDQLPDPAPAGPPVTRSGDLWLLGPHRLLCGDARDPAAFEVLLAGEKAQLVLTDPPYNVRVQGHICGQGAARHDEFRMASGEMSEAEYTGFLAVVCRNLRDASIPAAVAFVYMDWRHLRELLDAGRAAGFELLNLCVWAKNNGGMGSLYRSQHELVFVFRSGKGSHINNIQLGRHGRNRTNLWSYPGVSAFGVGRDEALAAHPTVKPVAMLADAILDCSHRDGLVLDAFAGSGSLFLAAEETGRRAAAMEIDPGYCDVAIARWQKFTGRPALLSGANLTFAEVRERRSAEGSPGSASGAERDVT